MMTPNAGKPDFGGRKEQEGTKGYAPDDLPLRDGHNEEPDVPSAPKAAEQIDQSDIQSLDADSAS